MFDFKPYEHKSRGRVHEYIGVNICKGQILISNEMMKLMGQPSHINVAVDEGAIAILISPAHPLDKAAMRLNKNKTTHSTACQLDRTMPKGRYFFNKEISSIPEARYICMKNLIGTTIDEKGDGIPPQHSLYGGANLR